MSIHLRRRPGQAVPLVLALVAVAVVLTVAFGVFAGDVVDAGRARTAADAAALAGVEGGRAASVRLAAAHDGTVTAWRRQGAWSRSPCGSARRRRRRAPPVVRSTRRCAAAADGRAPPFARARCLCWAVVSPSKRAGDTVEPDVDPDVDGASTARTRPAPTTSRTARPTARAGPPRRRRPAPGRAVGGAGPTEAPLHDGAGRGDRPTGAGERVATGRLVELDHPPLGDRHRDGGSPTTHRRPCSRRRAGGTDAGPGNHLSSTNDGDRARSADGGRSRSAGRRGGRAGGSVRLAAAHDGTVTAWRRQGRVVTVTVRVGARRRRRAPRVVRSTSVRRRGRRIARPRSRGPVAYAGPS